MFNHVRYAAVAAGLMLLTACGSTPNYYIGLTSIAQPTRTREKEKTKNSFER